MPTQRMTFEPQFSEIRSICYADETHCASRWRNALTPRTPARSPARGHQLTWTGNNAFLPDEDFCHCVIPRSSGATFGGAQRQQQPSSRSTRFDFQPRSLLKYRFLDHHPCTAFMSSATGTCGAVTELPYLVNVLKACNLSSGYKLAKARRTAVYFY